MPALVTAVFGLVVVGYVTAAHYLDRWNVARTHRVHRGGRIIGIWFWAGTDTTIVHGIAEIGLALILFHDAAQVRPAADPIRRRPVRAAAADRAPADHRAGGRRRPVDDARRGYLVGPAAGRRACPFFFFFFFCSNRSPTHTKPTEKEQSFFVGFLCFARIPSGGSMKGKPTPTATTTDLPETNRMIGRVVSVRPAAPGVIVVPGNRPDRFVFSSAKVANVEIGCLVTFTPLPPRGPEHDCGQAADVEFASGRSRIPTLRRAEEIRPPREQPPKHRREF